MNAIKLFFFALVIAGLPACINDEVIVPPEIISESDMVPILVDMHLIEGARSGNLVLGDTNDLPDYYAKIYLKHHVSEDEYNTSLAWYTENPALLKVIYEKVIVELSKLEADVKTKRAKEAAGKAKTIDEEE